MQLNDTHPTLTIPELMRLLMDDQRVVHSEAFFFFIRQSVQSNTLDVQ